MTLNKYTYCLNNPLIYIDPSGFREVLLRQQIERAGGTIFWDDRTQTAIATVNGVTITYDPAADSRIRINDQGRIVIDNKDIDRDFNEVTKHIMVDSRLGATKFEVYQMRHGLREIPGDLHQVVTSPEFKQAAKNTAYAVIDVHLGPITSWGFGEIIPSSGDPEFDEAISKVDTVTWVSPNKWFKLHTLYNKIRQWF